MIEAGGIDPFFDCFDLGGPILAVPHALADERAISRTPSCFRKAASGLRPRFIIHSATGLRRRLFRITCAILSSARRFGGKRLRFCTTPDCLCFLRLSIGSDCVRWRVVSARHFAFLAHPAAMPAVFSHHQDATQRLSEIAVILAAGLLRLRARKSSAFFRPSGESSLHCLPDQSAVQTVRENGKRP